MTVHYLKQDLTSEIIEEGEGNHRAATHALCCQGGLDIVEATALGVFETNLHNYLRGNCVLTVRESIPTPNAAQAKRATKFWDARVLDPYDWGMIFGTLPVVFCHYVLGFLSKRLGDWAVRKMPNILASSSLSTCAELAARGLREFMTTALSGYDVRNVTPEVLRTHKSLHTKAILERPVLEA